jgi:hypothetical protein
MENTIKGIAMAAIAGGLVIGSVALYKSYTPEFMEKVRSLSLFTKNDISADTATHH